ncbi:MAG: DUF523 domain-containing protein [Pseudomonadales bacterium]|nr:DUF523 domain-containing protein [Pseudomonadales bacterium]
MIDALAGLKPGLFLCTPQRKPRVGISSCLLGENVRYNGKSKTHPLIRHHLGDVFRLEAFCPEITAGLGTPRPPVQLVKSEEGVKAQGVDNKSIDITSTLIQTSKNYMRNKPDISAYIFKARSPSCGYGTAALFDDNGRTLATTNGLFADAIEKNFPDCLLVDESFFSCKNACLLFIFFCYLLDEAKMLQYAPHYSLNAKTTSKTPDDFLKHYDWLWEILVPEDKPKPQSTNPNFSRNETKTANPIHRVIMAFNHARNASQLSGQLIDRINQ